MVSLSSQVHDFPIKIISLSYGPMKSSLYFNANFFFIDQTNELYQLAAVAFCLLVAWVSPT